MAPAVVLDATVVRMLLVPATMKPPRPLELVALAHLRRVHDRWAGWADEGPAAPAGPIQEREPAPVG
ncbi:MAG: hypothetical protein ACRD2W_24640 [Acidimicrobiales bacterium]